jgi:holliday junction DNA helicase RuvA
VIAYLRGTARAINIVDVDGVGYLVHCVAPLVTGADVELHIHTQVREDAITLYGFANEDEKRVFEALVKVTGVGPSSALLLLSGLGAGGVAGAVHRRDIKTLSSVKGVGAKVAEKIITLMKLPDGVGALSGSAQNDEIVTLLQSLGYDRSTSVEAARKAVESSSERDGLDEAQLLAEAIKHAQEGKTRQ